MTLTNDQYQALSKMLKWYNKYQKQIIEISGVIGTGTWDLVQSFIGYSELDPREVAYLSYNQKQVLELAFQKYHSYYINNIIYSYTRTVNFDTLPIVDHNSKEIEYVWNKKVRNKIDPTYKMLVVFDSLLLSDTVVKDLASFGVPIILIRDPMLLPAPDTYTFLRDPNIELHDIHEDYLRNPIIFFSQKIINGEPLPYGIYDSLSIVPKRQMNLYNIKSADMNIALTDESMDSLNRVYRNKVLGRKDIRNVVGERVIVSETMYGERIINPDNEKVRLYMTKGMVGSLSKINKHAVGTKYVPIDFKPDFYHESFVEMYIDRHYLNNINIPSQQMVPDDVAKLKYAYALTPMLARFNHWNKVSIVVDYNIYNDEELQKRLLYTAITRAKKSVTILR